MNYHRRGKWTKPVQSQITKHVSYYVFIIFLSIYKNVKPKRNRKPTNSNRKTRKANRKLEIARINKIKKLKELETTKKDLEELEIGKTNETIAIILKEILLPYFLG